ncbi:MAG: GDSL-type esterase/lipase family protein [Gracilimonas sp.]|nr:GDSL-type esterase/lipase family protein [Gracilimonas sp.]
MKLFLKIGVLGLSLLFVGACDNENATGPEETTVSINKIMPLGASRVEGARPVFESYRYDLWIDLKENGWTFDFIGTRLDQASYPPHEGDEFDKDHEGRSGWTSGQILNGIEGWLSDLSSPDIVLFSSPGGNDGLNGLPYEQAVSNINSIIDILQANNPDVTVIIEQMAPGRSDIMNAELTTYFEKMQQEVENIATDQTTSTSQVIAVDMYSEFKDSYLSDEVHYNEEGADFIANRYYDELINVLEE